MNKRGRRVLLSIVVVILVAAIGIGVSVYLGLGKTLGLVSSSLPNDSKDHANNGNVMQLLTPEPLNGESTGVVNILLAGNSSDDPNHDGGDLTDSMMVASLNLTDHKVSLFSLPRDLYVNYQGSWMRLNAVYPLGGMSGLATEIGQITGLTINQRVLVNYTALKDIINDIGGIDITIDSPDPRGIFDPNTDLRLASGVQHMDGQTALNLARARNDPPSVGKLMPYGLPNGDFDRTANQRLIIKAILTKVTQTPALANPTTLLSLLDSIGVNAKSDLTVGQLRRLIDLRSELTTIDQINLSNTSGQSLFADYRTPEGADVLVPAAGQGVYTKIKAVIAAQLG